MLLPIVIGIVWLIATDTSDDELCRTYFQNFKDSHFIGKVVKKYIDTKQHNSRIIIIEDSKKSKLLTFDWDRSDFYNYVNIKDTIVKLRNDSTIRIIRNESDTVIEIDYGCY